MSAAHKSPGTASDLSQSSVVTIGARYKVSFRVLNYTAGTITPYCGSSGAGSPVAANGTFDEIITAAGSTDLIFKADADFEGSIDDVSVRLANRGIEITDEGIKGYASDGSLEFHIDPTDGIIKAISFITESGSGKRIEINPNNDNEMHFYGNRGDGTVEQLATIGIRTIGSDPVIGSFGSANSTRTAVRARSSGAITINADTTNSTVILGDCTLSGAGDGGGVVGRLFGTSTDTAVKAGVSGSDTTSDDNRFGGSFFSQNGYGARCAVTGTGKGPLLLEPSGSASAPTHSANKGTLWVTSAGVLYINTNGSTTWAKVGAQ